MGENSFQIRTTSRRFARWLNVSLAPYRVRKKARVAFSIVLAGGEEERIRARKSFHILYAGNQRIVRTKDIGTLVRGLFAEIEQIFMPERDDAIYVQTPAITLDGKMALVPDFLRQTLARLGRRPELAGLRLPVERLVAVDPDTGRVVPMVPQVEIPADAIDRVTKLFGANGNPTPSPIERPTSPDFVVGHVPNAVAEDHMQPMSRGRALYCLASEAVNLQKIGIERTLEALAHLIEEADCYSYYPEASSPEGRTRMLTGLADLLKS